MATFEGYVDYYIVESEFYSVEADSQQEAEEKMVDMAESEFPEGSDFEATSVREIKTK